MIVRPLAAEPAEHCAKFSAEILEAIEGVLEREDPDEAMTVLDPFAGIGLVHRLAGARTVIASELEYEWIAQGGDRSLVADVLALPFPDDSVDAIVTSPCYGNRMADLYDGQGMCRLCRGHPADLFGSEPCRRCGGAGHDTSTRYTYRISLGRDLTRGSAAGLRWGSAYRRFHRAAWIEATRVLRPGGLFVLNISDHIRQVGRRKERQHVSAWHHNTLVALGYDIIDLVDVDTSRNGNGANRDVRVPYEHVIAYRAAA